MFYGVTPFSVAPLSSLGITSIKGASVLEAIAKLVAAGVTDVEAANIDAVAILEADGTLTLGGEKAELNAVVNILASSTVKSKDVQVFIWTAPSRPTTWSFSEEYSGDKLIWIIPTGVGASTWSFPEKYNEDKLIWVIPTGVGATTWVLPK